MGADGPHGTGHRSHSNRPLKKMHTIFPSPTNLRVILYNLVEQLKPRLLIHAHTSVSSTNKNIMTHVLSRFHATLD